MEEKKQKFYLYEGSWDQYLSGQLKLYVKFQRTDQSMLIKKVAFLECSDNSKRLAVYVEDKNIEEVIKLAEKYSVDTTESDFLGGYHIKNKVVIQNFLKLLFNHYDFDGHEENILKFFNDVPKYPGKQGLMIHYKGSWPNRVTYRRNLLDNYLDELEIYNNYNDNGEKYLKVSTRFECENSKHKLIPYLRSEGLLIESRDLLCETYTTETTNESLKLLNALLKNNSWNSDDLKNIEMIMNEYFQ